MGSAAKKVTYIQDHFRSTLIAVCTRAVDFNFTTVTFISHQKTDRGARSTTARARLLTRHKESNTSTYHEQRSLVMISCHTREYSDSTTSKMHCSCILCTQQQTLDTRIDLGSSCSARNISRKLVSENCVEAFDGSASTRTSQWHPC